VNPLFPTRDEPVLKRLLWLYGLYMLLSNAAYLLGYYLIPEGALRQGPQAAPARIAGGASSFWGELALTLLFNVGLVVIAAVIMNLNQVKGFPAGYLYPICLGIISGLISGTNSFTASDLTKFNARDGMALGLSIGNVEMLGYILVIAATVKFGVYKYRSWWRWSGEWKPEKLMPIRDIRLARDEVIILALGIGLVVAAAIRETLMAHAAL
jgi:hypothetical protein